jgi:RNA polymerase sigma-70 factor (ECF subfamily)
VPTPTLRFDEVYREHVAFVFRTARYLGVPAREVEDAAQDVFVSVSRKLAEYDGRVSLQSWLYGFVRRVVADRRRRHRRKESKLSVPSSDQGLDMYEGTGPGPLASSESSEALRRVDAVVSRLSPEKREAFLMSELEGLTAVEIADVTQTNINTIYTRIRSAREEVSALYTSLYGAGEGSPT